MHLPAADPDSHTHSTINSSLVIIIIIIIIQSIFIPDIVAKSIFFVHIIMFFSLQQHQRRMHGVLFQLQRLSYGLADLPRP